MRKVEIKQYEKYSQKYCTNWKICSVCMRATKGLSTVKAVVQHREQDIRKQARLKKWPYVMASVKAGYTGQLSSAQASQDAQWPEVSYRTNCQILQTSI